MGLLGGGAVAAMQQSLKNNKGLTRKKKSLKDITENYPEKDKDKEPLYNKMTHIEFEEFKMKLKEQKEKGKKQRLKILVALIIIGIIILFSVI